MYLVGLLTAGGILTLSGTALAAPAQVRPAAPSVTAVGAVGGLVWFDRNYDRVPNRDEPGVAGAHVTATDLRSGRSYSAITDRDGSYVIQRIPAGRYVVSTDDARYLPTTRQDVPVTVRPGAASTANFGIAGGTVSGVAWFDQNQDGIRQAYEPRVSGIPVVVGNSRTASAVTGRDGRYLVQDVPAGNHAVRFVLPQDRALGFTEPFVGDATTDSDVEDVGQGLAFVNLDVASRELADVTNVDAGLVRR